MRTPAAAKNACSRAASPPGWLETPSERTVCHILKSAQRVKERKKRGVLSLVDKAPEVDALTPNEVRTIDFNGWWRVRMFARQYPEGFRTALVYNCGGFPYDGQKYNVSQSLAGHHIGLEYLNPLQLRAWFHEIDLGTIEIEPRVNDSIFDQSARKRHKRKAKRQQGQTTETTATVNLT
jgi:hypothetical protein